MPRLFSGIEIPAPVAQRLTLVRAGLTGARWIDSENYHLTLRFLGDVDGTVAREFAHSLGDIVALGHDPETVRRVLRMVDGNEYKRRQSPIGVKITPRAFGRDWRLPIVNRFRQG